MSNEKPGSAFAPTTGYAACQECPLCDHHEKFDAPNGGMCKLHKHMVDAETPACGHMRAAIEIGNERSRLACLYEFVRTLNATQFADLFLRNISGEGHFDDLVAQEMSKRAARHNGKLNDGAKTEAATNGN